MGNLGFQEIFLMLIVIGVIVTVILVVIKILTGKPSNNRTQNMSAYNDLEKLHSLKEKGIITQEEFDAKKEKLLNK